MREHEKASVFAEAIDVLVAKAVDAKRPASPGAYAATVRADLRDRLHPVARALYARHGELTAEHLVTLLEAHERHEPAEPEPSAVTTGNLALVDASTFHHPPADKATTRERIAGIKAQLATVTKPPMPESDASTRGAVAGAKKQ
jgi:hypothetical protein